MKLQNEDVMLSLTLIALINELNRPAVSPYVRNFSEKSYLCYRILTLT